MGRAAVQVWGFGCLPDGSQASLSCTVVLIAAEPDPKDNHLHLSIQTLMYLSE